VHQRLRSGRRTLGHDVSCRELHETGSERRIGRGHREIEFVQRREWRHIGNEHLGRQHFARGSRHQALMRMDYVEVTHVVAKPIDVHQHFVVRLGDTESLVLNDAGWGRGDHCSIACLKSGKFA
jgi:hypothetical protein